MWLEMRRMMVKFKSAVVFNGFFGMQKSTKNTQKSHEIRMKRINGAGVYHVRVNYTAPLREM